MSTVTAIKPAKRLNKSVGVTVLVMPNNQFMIKAGTVDRVIDRVELAAMVQGRAA